MLCCVVTKLLCSEQVPHKKRPLYVCCVYTSGVIQLCSFHHCLKPCTQSHASTRVRFRHARTLTILVCRCSQKVVCRSLIAGRASTNWRMLRLHCSLSPHTHKPHSCTFNFYRLAGCNERALPRSNAHQTATERAQSQIDLVLVQTFRRACDIHDAVPSRARATDNTRTRANSKSDTMGSAHHERGDWGGCVQQQQETS